jgi:hypothetical protein
MWLIAEILLTLVLGAYSIVTHNIYWLIFATIILVNIIGKVKDEA